MKHPTTSRIVSGHYASFRRPFGAGATSSMQRDERI
jgi:hypothetical protein